MIQTHPLHRRPAGGADALGKLARVVLKVAQVVGMQFQLAEGRDPRKAQGALETGCLQPPGQFRTQPVRGL